MINIEQKDALQASAKQNNVKFCFLDPPYFTQYNYGDFNDTWESMDAYLSFLYPIIKNIHANLREDGVLALMCDYHANYKLRQILDEIFGKENFANEFLTLRSAKNGRNQRSSLFTSTDCIYIYYRNAEKGIIHVVPHRSVDTTEERWSTCTAKGKGGPKVFFGKIIYPPEGRHFMWSQETIDKKIAEGVIKLNSNGNPLYLVTNNNIPVGTLWDDIPAYSNNNGYATEKSFDLLQRLIMMYTEEGDLVTDYFCGSGTTAYVSLSLNRNCYSSDINLNAIEKTKKRCEL